MSFPIRIPIGHWIDLVVIWLTDNLATAFDTVSRVVGFILVKIDFFSTGSLGLFLLALSL